MRKSYFHRIFLLFLCLVFVTPLLQADPLFESSDTFDIQIEAPFSQIRRERDKEEYSGKLDLGDASFDVIVSVRGNNRLRRDICKNPPLWIDLVKGEMAGTPFEHQNRLKLVVLCKKPAFYQDYLRAEYLTYKMYEAISGLSFKTRWVNVTFVEEGKTRREHAFFIEHKSTLEKRLGLVSAEVEKISLTELEPLAATTAALFQYVIANADYSLTTALVGECCHNAKLLVSADGRYLPLLYDFDSSGLVNAKYALPPDNLGIKRVTSRVYQGYCRNNEYLTAARSTLLAAEEQLFKIIKDDDLLSPKSIKRMTRFLADAFKVLGDDAKFTSSIVEKCRGSR